MSLKNSNDTIGNRTRDLTVCSVVHLYSSSCWICDGQSVILTGFSSNNLFSSVRDQFSNTPYPFIYHSVLIKQVPECLYFSTPTVRKIHFS